MKVKSENCSRKSHDKENFAAAAEIETQAVTHYAARCKQRIAMVASQAKCLHRGYSDVYNLHENEQ